MQSTLVILARSRRYILCSAARHVRICWLSKSKCPKWVSIFKSCQKLQRIQLKLFIKHLKTFIQKVWKKCSLTQFQYNSDSAKDINRGGNVNLQLRNIGYSQFSVFVLRDMYKANFFFSVSSFYLPHYEIPKTLSF